MGVVSKFFRAPLRSAQLEEGGEPRDSSLLGVGPIGLRNREASCHRGLAARDGSNAPVLLESLDRVL